MERLGLEQARKLVQKVSTSNIPISDQQLDDIAMNLANYEFSKPKEKNAKPYIRLPIDTEKYKAFSESTNPMYSFEIRRIIFNDELLKYIPPTLTIAKERTMRMVAEMYPSIMSIVSNTNLVKRSDLINVIRLDEELVRAIDRIRTNHPYSLLANRSTLITMPGTYKDKEITKSTPILLVPGLEMPEQKYLDRWQERHTIQR